MAEIIGTDNKSGKHSTRVDLTPMVDLGFLLITFFIFTTTLSKPTGLKINLPKPVPENQEMQTTESGALTILLMKDRIIYSYEGADPSKMILADENSIRKIVMGKKRKTSPEKLMVIIKPGKNSDFKSLVHVLDEMTINAVKHYAMVDPDPVEYSFMKPE